MHYTLSDLSYYDKAYEIKKKMIDEQNYMMGVYNYKALETAFYNFSLGFDSKNKHKPKQYLDKPFLMEEVKKSLSEMTDEEYNAELQKAIDIEQQYMNNSKLPKTRISRR